MTRQQSPARDRPSTIATASSSGSETTLTFSSLDCSGGWTDQKSNTRRPAPSSDRPSNSLAIIARRLRLGAVRELDRPQIHLCGRKHAGAPPPGEAVAEPLAAAEVIPRIGRGGLERRRLGGRLAPDDPGMGKPPRPSSGRSPAGPLHLRELDRGGAQVDTDPSSVAGGKHAWGSFLSPLPLGEGSGVRACAVTQPTPKT